MVAIRITMVDIIHIMEVIITDGADMDTVDTGVDMGIVDIMEGVVAIMDITEDATSYESF